LTVNNPNPPSSDDIERYIPLTSTLDVSALSQTGVVLFFATPSVFKVKVKYDWAG